MFSARKGESLFFTFSSHHPSISPPFLCEGPSRVVGSPFRSLVRPRATSRALVRKRPLWRIKGRWESLRRWCLRIAKSEGIRRHTSFRTVTLSTWRCDAMRVWNALRRNISLLFDLLLWHRWWQLGEAYRRLQWTSDESFAFFLLFWKSIASW